MGIRALSIILLMLGMIGCRSKKIQEQRSRTSTPSAPSRGMMQLFEAEHTDLFFPFSRQDQFFQHEQQSTGDSYLIRCKVKTPIEQIGDQYRTTMEMYGWRAIIALSAYLLFEKPHARCMLIFTTSSSGYTDITMIYHTLHTDDLYSLI